MFRNLENYSGGVTIYVVNFESETRRRYRVDLIAPNLSETENRSHKYVLTARKIVNTK